MGDPTSSRTLGFAQLFLSLPLLWGNIYFALSSWCLSLFSPKFLVLPNVAPKPAYLAFHLEVKDSCGHCRQTPQSKMVEAKFIT